MSVLQLVTSAVSTAGPLSPPRSRQRLSVACRSSSTDGVVGEDATRRHRSATLVGFAGAALTSASLLFAAPSIAELNPYEYNAGGEFGVGTAQQFGEADIKGKNFSGQVSEPRNVLLCSLE